MANNKRMAAITAARPIITPKGRFASAALAAVAFGITPRVAQAWAREQRNGWRYEGDKEKGVS